MTRLLRPEPLDRARGLDEVVLAGELPRLLVVERQHVDVLQHALQIVVGDRDPQVHGVEADQPRPLHLQKHPELQPRLNVGEEQELAPAVCRRQLGREVLEAR
jgi:hypothetical protein